MTERCRTPGCGAEVVFVPSATTGRPMILDAKPAKGVVLKLGGFAGAPIVARRVGAPGPDEVALVVDVYTDHHATCPGAKAWKGRTRRDPP